MTCRYERTTRSVDLELHLFTVEGSKVLMDGGDDPARHQAISKIDIFLFSIISIHRMLVHAYLMYICMLRYLPTVSCTYDIICRMYSVLEWTTPKLMNGKLDGATCRCDLHAGGAAWSGGG